MTKKDLETTNKTDLGRRLFLKQSSVAVASLSVAGALLQPEAAKAAPAPTPTPAPAPAAPAASPSPARSGMKYLFVDREACTGCNACQTACSQYHENGVYRPSLSRIHVRRYKSIVDVPIICWHCEDAPCVQACPVTPTKSIVKNKETNVIVLDEKTCLGATCNKCMEACPAQYLRRHPDTAKPMFCDLCGGDPQCVRACERMADKELTPCLATKKSGGGVNIAYRDVGPDEAAEGLILDMYYPNSDGGRK